MMEGAPEIPQFPPPNPEKYMIVYPTDIVPFFIKVKLNTYEGTLCDIIQLPLEKANSKEIAQNICDDMQLHQSIENVTQSIEEQIIDYRHLANMEVPLELFPDRNPTSIHTLQIAVGINNVIYNDVLEWDVFDRTANPDHFARITVEELGLPPEFVNVISAQIRYQCLRIRSMFSNPQKFQEYIKSNPDVAPQTTCYLRSVADLIDVSPAVGLVPGAKNAKREKASRDRNRRYYRREGQVASEALIADSDLTPISNCELVPIVRAVPLPEDSPLIDLTAIPDLLTNITIDDDDELLRKVANKFKNAAFLPMSDSDDNSESD